MTIAIVSILMSLTVCYRLRHWSMPVVGSRLPEDDRFNMAEGAFDAILFQTYQLVLWVIVIAGGSLV
ncbi:MAG: hypothetical protein CMF22_12050 [Idiomarinaceae bacterium]|nr:hypothetical protein [Idiomarinaceae bacterium]